MHGGAGAALLPAAVRAYRTLLPTARLAASQTRAPRRCTCRTCAMHARHTARAVHGCYSSPLLHVVHVHPAAAVHMRRLQALVAVHAVHGAACAVLLPTTRPAARRMCPAARSAAAGYCTRTRR